MKIQISDHDEVQSHIPSENDHDTDVPTMAGSIDDSVGQDAGEVAGQSGAHVTGGDLTDTKDAGAMMDENIETRNAEQDMWAQQNKGEVGNQTVDLKPASAHPESGMPENATNSENSGGSNATGDATETAGGADAAQKKSDLDSAARDAINAAQSDSNSPSVPAGATTNETARAGAEHDEKFLRLAADFENYKRQAARRAGEDSERAARRILADLLPVLDNFERALQAPQTPGDAASFRMGVEFIAQQLRDALRGHGIESIQTKGQQFNPLLHEALEQVSGSGQPEGTITDEAQRGYTYKGQVMRPSLVRVAGK